MKLLENKNAVITGGSGGIGLAIARKMAENGAAICLLARDKKQLVLAKKELEKYGTSIHFISADLSDTRQLEVLSKKILNIFPSIHILVNNAGIARFIPFEKMSEETLDLHLDLNIKSMYLLTKFLFQSLKQSGGNVLNISSYLSHRMLSGRATTAYSASKGAVDSFTKSLAFEAGSLGVRVNGIAPGSVATELLSYNYNQLDEREKKHFDKMVRTIYPLKKLGEPEDIAEMALFLTSESARWMTGAIIPVDGGLTTN